ncbi:MAG: peptidylprolyl isomerase [Armatimonadota bacterium]|nr:peptidylprolyl isomerase [Armatimonadota bacterium]
MKSRHNSGKSEWKLWVAFLVLLGGFIGAQYWLSATPTKYERVDLPLPQTRAERIKKLPEATMAPGRVVELDTTRGRIDFVLFEKDCPITTARIVELVQNKDYDGVKFTRVVPNALIQTGPVKNHVSPIKLEVLRGLVNTKGAVGMARASDPNSATSQFYILLEPWRHLDYDYAVFGRLIRGMDVAFRIRQGDVIKKAKLRALTPEDRKLFDRVLQIEAERATE